MKYFLIVLKAHAGGHCNVFSFNTPKELEEAMDKNARAYDYDCEHDYMVIRGEELNIELAKTHTIRGS